MDILLILQYWYIFPVSIVIATIAVGVGMGGAIFFSPFFMLIGISPKYAIATGLATQIFGLTSGSISYYKKGLLNLNLARKIIIVTVPLSMLGAIITLRFIENEFLLKVIFSVGLFVLGTTMLFLKENKEKIKKEQLEIQIDEKGRKYSLNNYKINKNINKIRAVSGVGAIFDGLISMGLGETTLYQLISIYSVPSRIAVAVTVFVGLCSAIASSIIYISGGIFYYPILCWTIPGVIIGAQIGSSLTNVINSEKLKKIISCFFVFASCFIIYNTVF